MGSQSYEKPDFWSKKAFSEGYPARSVYKLQEMDERFKILKKNTRVLDLGAAPGSWSLYAARRLENGGSVTAIDLQPLSPSIREQNIHFILGDLYSPQIRDQAIAAGPYQVVMCDAAPPTSGNRTIDTAKSAGLVELALFYAETMLQTGGHCLVKIFQGGDQQFFLKKMRELFETARGFKPEACRAESFETYLIGLSRK